MKSITIMQKSLLVTLTALTIVSLPGCASTPSSVANEISEDNDSGSSVTEISKDGNTIGETAITETASTETTVAEETQEQKEAEYTLQEMEFFRDDMKICGRLYLPAGDGPFPVAIMAHGLGQNMGVMDGYAKLFAKDGIAAFTFDFIGGGHAIRSDGKMTDMSVLTEAADFNIVFDGIRSLDMIDANNVYVMGDSQGGFVATYIACTRPEEVKGLIALYPAYILQDDAKERTKDGTQFYDTFNLLGMTLSRQYDEDLLSFDIYEIMKNYNGDVLLIQGTKDQLVPIADSERAAETFSSAELILIEGAGHGFNGNDQTYAAQCAIDFIKNKAAD
ncbi:MAG: lysophospholipase [Lachnospiraceae bacterium]|nr:lysophospholipase [Lachnospiraceae bacterium]